VKKTVSLILIITLMLGLCVSASAQTEKTIDELLAPYQTVIDKLNTELGTTFYIPYENREKVYNNIKNKTPDEFEALLREEYKDLNSDPSNRIQPHSDNYTRDYAMGKNSEPDIIPNFSGSIHLTPLK